MITRTGHLLAISALAAIGAIGPGCYSTASFRGDGQIREGAQNSAYGYVISFPPIDTEVACRAEYTFHGAPPELFIPALAIKESQDYRLKSAHVRYVLRDEGHGVILDKRRSGSLMSPYARQSDDELGVAIMFIDMGGAKLDEGTTYHLTVEVEPAATTSFTIIPMLFSTRTYFVL